MTERQRRFFSGPTLDRALLEAAGYLEIPVEEVRYQEVPKKTGLARGRGVTIRIDKGAPPKESAKRESSKDRSSAESTEEPKTAREERSKRDGEAVERQADADGTKPERSTKRSTAPQQRTAQAEAERSEDSGESEGETARHEHGDESSAVEEKSAAASEEQPRGERVEFPAGPEDLVPRDSGPDTELTRSAARWIEAILDLADLDAEARVEERDGPLVWLDLSGPDEDFLLEDSGQLLQAIQHLMPRLMQSDLGRVVPCVADSGGFREFHGERLRVQAVAAAEEVRRNGKAISLDPMNPPDRREVHLALAEDPAVDTESSGRGYFKRITVRPA